MRSMGTYLYHGHTSPALSFRLAPVRPDTGMKKMSTHTGEKEVNNLQTPWLRGGKTKIYIQGCQGGLPKSIYGLVVCR